jgi:23S rRNA (adenine-N6)-dimethyltransferase
VRAAGVSADDLVVDIGAGTGRLTAELARVARRVIAVEPDQALARRLAGRWTNVDVVEADVVDVALPDEPFSVVANLPFGRTTDILHLLLDDPRVRLRTALLVVQWEVAVRHGVPWPSSRNGVIWTAFYSARVARRLPARAFVPPPAVDAGVLVFERRREPLVPVERAEAFARFVAQGFRRGLRGRQARDVDVHEWAELFARATSSSGRRGAGRSSSR